MHNILNMKIEQIAGKSFECICGKSHSVDIEKIICEKDSINSISEICQPFESGKIFLICDSNTFEICGKKASEILINENFNVKTFIYQQKSELSQNNVVPDEKALGRLLLEIEAETSLIVTCGSGSLNDLSRMISYKLNIPYIIIATAPSMDGYASVVSPLIVEGFKTTFEAVYPYAVVGDLGILATAPVDMIRAGFGDILGKLTALADWELARQIKKEYWCETSVNMVKNALLKCMENASNVTSKSENTIRYIFEALLLSGVAMGLVGNSRPASGAEHHLAHYWEMDALKNGEEHALHGNAVGVGTLVVARIYELMAEFLPKTFIKPSFDEIRLNLIKAGCASKPQEIGVSKELFERSIKNAYTIRTRFTISHFAKELGKLNEIAEIITNEFYK